MNKAILIVICDFLVSAMLTMMTGMVPGHSGGTGVGLDESTTKVLLSELNRRQIELEVMRAKLMEAFARTGSTPEQEAELRKITEELAKNLVQQDKLRSQLALPPGDAVDSKELKIRLEEEEQRRKELELTLADTQKDLAAKIQLLADNSIELRDKERDNAVLNFELKRTRHSLEKTGEALDNTRRDLLKEQDRHGITQEKLAASEAARDAAVASAALSSADAVKARRELGVAQKELLDETRSHSETKSRLAAAEVEKNAAAASAEAAGKALAAANTELENTRQQRDAARNAGSEAQTRLASAQSDLRTLQRDLSNSRRDLQSLENSNSKMEGEVNKLNLKLVKVESVVNTREKDLAELRDELNRERQKLLVERLKRQDAETRTAMTESAYKELVEHNSKTQQENTRLVQENARIAAEKASEKNNPADTPSPELAILAPVTVFERYSGSLLRVENLITEKKLFGERGQKLASFYPAVDFGNNRIMITGASHRFAGDWLDALKFIDVNKVEINFASFYDNKLTPISGNMLISRNMPHIAGFPVQLPKTCQPIKPLTFSELRKRGIEELYLFKCDVPDAQTKLTGRVSLSADPESPAIFIRNSGMSIKAAYGDLVLTAQGEFVGIVAGAVKVDNANIANAVKVPLVNDVAKMWEQPWMIPLDKNPQEDFYSSFANKMREFRSNVKSRYE